jgi:Uma2 family endonuclease
MGTRGWRVGDDTAMFSNLSVTSTPKISTLKLVERSAPDCVEAFMAAVIPQLQIPESQLKPQSEIIYPTGDGEPVAETFDHLYALLITLEVLRQYLSGQQATVLGNQFLYYAENFPKLRVAPDVMVIFDVEPGGRDSFKVWEEKAVPSVIFEMTSASTRQKDEGTKYDLYEGLGVTEYWQFDPKGEWIEEHLRGYRLVDDTYRRVTNNISQVLQLRLVPEGKLIGFYTLETGQRLPLPEELRQRWLEADERANQEAQRAEQEAQRAEQEAQRAEQEAQRAEQEAQRAERLAERLRSLGINPDEV